MFKYAVFLSGEMVLEAIIDPFQVKKKPYQMFLAGAIYALVGAGLSYVVFRDVAGILTVFLIVMAGLPMLYTAIKNEEELDLQISSEWSLLKEHGKVLLFLLFMFLGITAALTGLYLFLPHEITSSLFRIQEQAILNVNAAVQGNVITGNVLSKLSLLGRIFLNNLKVLFFCVVFAVLYGAGSLFILTWNASVIATAMGNLMRSRLGEAASAVGLSSIGAYFSSVTFGFLRYMTHGAFEIAAYFIAGLAGGILSVAFIKHNFTEEKVFIDVLDLLLVSLGVLFFAAVVEVFVTPFVVA